MRVCVCFVFLCYHHCCAIGFVCLLSPLFFSQCIVYYFLFVFVSFFYISFCLLARCVRLSVSFLYFSHYYEVRGNYYAVCERLSE